jgi:prepilin-type N-terminal cleavage/methylation domain-containing protein
MGGNEPRAQRARHFESTVLGVGSWKLGSPPRPVGVGRSRSARAFTLVEILVATAILSLLAGLLMSIANQVGTAWRDGQSANERRSTGRAILDFMAAEMQQASTGISHPEVIDYKTTTSPPDIPFRSLHLVASLPALIGAASDDYPDTTSVTSNASAPYLNPHALFWQAPVARNTSGGALASIGYFVRWVGTEARLCRLQVDAADTANFTVTKPKLINQQVSPVNWLTGSILNSFAPATAPTYRGWFADNVIGLWVRPLDAFGRPIQFEAKSGIPVKINNGFGLDSRRGYISNGPDGVYGNADDIKVAGPALPPAIEIAIVTLDSTRASRITDGDVTTIRNLALAKASDPSKMWDAADGIPGFLTGLPVGLRQAARCFSTTVYLTNAR